VLLVIATSLACTDCCCDLSVHNEVSMDVDSEVTDRYGWWNIWIADPDGSSW